MVSKKDLFFRIIKLFVTLTIYYENSRILFFKNWAVDNGIIGFTI